VHLRPDAGLAGASAPVVARRPLAGEAPVNVDAVAAVPVVLVQDPLPGLETLS
jgi:hypothetical protein